MGRSSFLGNMAGKMLCCQYLARSIYLDQITMHAQISLHSFIKEKKNKKMTGADLPRGGPEFTTKLVLRVRFK